MDFLENGFAHYYVAHDGILQAEDDINHAWHCGDTNGNNNYLSIEVCQSMGDIDIFKSNEEKALQHRTKPEHNSIASRNVCNIMSA